MSGWNYATFGQVIQHPEPFAMELFALECVRAQGRKFAIRHQRLTWCHMDMIVVTSSTIRSISLTQAPTFKAFLWRSAESCMASLRRTEKTLR